MAKKCVNKVTDACRVSNRMIVIKVFIQGIIISVISVYASQCGLDDSEKDDFYVSLINVFRKLEEKGIVVISGNVNGRCM